MHTTEITTPFFWVALGLALVIAEMFSMALVLLFFGIGALVVAIGKYLGLNHLPTETALFAAIGIGGLLFLRKKIRHSLVKGPPAFNPHQEIILSTHIPARGKAQIEYQGTVWTGVNESDETLKKGAKVRIERTDGIQLVLKEVL